jgi:hypothetical protein
MDDLVELVISYYNPETDFQYIKLEVHRNGNTPNDFYDSNWEFRTKVLLRVKELNYEVSIELLRDLYIETAKESVEIWACYQYFHEIGQALIEKGKTKYIMDYLHYAKYSFDVLLSGGRAVWSDEIVIEMRNYLEKEKKIQTDERILQDIEFGLSRRFGEYRIKNTSSKK